MNSVQFPVYIPSKGRWENPLTSMYLARDGVEHKLVVEPQEYDSYAERLGENRLLVLPFGELGKGSIPARNWIWDHARSSGAAKHWILDDNIRGFYRAYRGRRLPCNARVALAVTETFADRYENLAIVGLNYTMYGINGSARGLPPFYANSRVYSCMLIRNDLPFRWRGRYNEDVDLCLQVLSSGWCTALLNVFMINKQRTMTMKGGNTDQLYAGDGRAQMARSIERVWPGVVTVTRRYGRPQHHINWTKFDTPLKLKPGVDLAALAATDEYGMKVVRR